jgi:hypothetical protein
LPRPSYAPGATTVTYGCSRDQEPRACKRVPARLP